ncbi:hypothetical protein [Streptomyces sp. NBC_01497]|uniref:hypothetical protein n=1 Tax=Streptomyces sp. NBC_01497 TaxID=2903885 RepID=UPI002E2EB14F|nr:hypothetical protein [Streptomyces sp. NBC_01497]
MQVDDINDGDRPHEGDFDRGLAAFAQDLKQLCRDRGKPSYRDITRRAEQIDSARPLPQGTVSGIFNGNRLPQLPTLVALVRTLLAHGEDGRPCDPPSYQAHELKLWRHRWSELDLMRESSVRGRAARGRPALVLAPEGEPTNPKDPAAEEATASVLADAHRKAEAIEAVALARAEEILAEAQADRDQAAAEKARQHTRIAGELEEARQEREQAAADAARIREQAITDAANEARSANDAADSQSKDAAPGGCRLGDSSLPPAASTPRAGRHDPRGAGPQRDRLRHHPGRSGGDS